MFFCRRGRSLRALLTGKSIRDKLRESLQSPDDRDKRSATMPTLPGLTSPPSNERRFSRLFSLRRSATTLPVESLPSSSSLSTSSSSASSSSSSSSSSSYHPISTFSALNASYHGEANSTAGSASASGLHWFH